LIQGRFKIVAGMFQTGWRAQAAGGLKQLAGSTSWGDQSAAKNGLAAIDILDTEAIARD
jgi:hypothetical protein